MARFIFLFLCKDLMIENFKRKMCFKKQKKTIEHLKLYFPMKTHGVFFNFVNLLIKISAMLKSYLYFPSIQKKITPE